MAKMELRSARNALLEEKAKLDQQMISIQDRYIRWQTSLQENRHAQFGYREAKEAMSNTNSNKPARRVFDAKIAEHQLEIDKILKELDQVEKERVVVGSKIRAMDKSIKELQNA